MSRHLADHQREAAGGRVKHFLRIARNEGDPGSGATNPGGANPGGAIWNSLHQKPHAQGDQNRRMREFLRIERGRST